MVDDREQNGYKRISGPGLWAEGLRPVDRIHDGLEKPGSGRLPGV